MTHDLVLTGNAPASGEVPEPSAPPMLWRPAREQDSSDCKFSAARTVRQRSSRLPARSSRLMAFSSTKKASCLRQMHALRPAV